MNDSARDLRSRIEAFAVDGERGCALPFAERLARENGWTRGYAERVFAEYKRFLYLAALGEHAVTPSDAVDQTWHLHLVYTRSYWDELCGKLLGRPLHHHPTLGGPEERARFLSQYAATLDSYARVFGERPDPRIWPAPAQRFRAGRRYATRYRSALAFLALGAISCTSLSALESLLGLVLIAGIAFGIRALIQAARDPSKRGSDCGSTCEGCDSGDGGGCGGGSD